MNHTSLNTGAARECVASYAQRRLWFFEQMQPGTSVLHLSIALNLSGALNVEALERAIAQVQKRHETLRTTFAERNGELVQVISAAAVVPFEHVDLRGLPEIPRGEELKRISDACLGQPFDLGRGPIWRACLIQQRDDKFRLIVCLHHLVSDGFSQAIFLRELGILYKAYSENVPNPLPALPWQYGDFSSWQRQPEHDAAIESSLAFWVDRLHDAPASLELPADRPQPAIQAYRGKTVSTSFDKALTWRLERLGRDRGATLFMVLLAGFSALMARLSGQDDLVVGAPVAGRIRPDVEPLIGLFINTLPLRMNLGGNPTFRSLIDRAKTTACEAFEHQTVPFEQIVAAVRPDRAQSNTPLFQVLFNMQQVAGGLSVPIGRVVAQIETGFELASKFDLTAYVTRRTDGVDVALVYNADLFDEARMEEMVAQYRQVLTQVVEQPDIELAAIDLRTPGASSRLPDPTAPLVRVNAGSIAARVREHALAAPNRTAVAWPGGTWTYDELNRRSDALAAALRAGGIGVGDVVSIYAHRSAPLVLSLLGVLRAGAAFSILDPAAPAQRLQSCVQTARPTGFIGIAGAGQPGLDLQQEIDASCRCRIDVGEDYGVTGLDSSCEERNLELDPDRLTYVAFTSGSTGGVKAIAGTERPLTHFLDWHVRTFGLTSADAFSVLSGLAHDPLLRDILTPLWVGGRLELPPVGELRDADALARWMSERYVSVTHVTPPMARLLSDAAARAETRFSSLRYVFCAGDALTLSVVDHIRAAAPHAECINFYGATETPQAMAFWRVPMAPSAISLGAGIDGVQLLVMSASGRLAGIGEPGEICIRTPYLSLGYRGDPRLTAQRFVANPFTADAEDRLYRSGDIGRYRPDGTVEFGGRADSQVKIRGFRVELQEIEHALHHHPSVGAVVAVAREDAQGSRCIVAYWVPRDGQTVSAADLRATVRPTLPDYAVPSIYVEVPALPLTPNGKIDRAALAAFPIEAESSRQESVAPRTRVERLLGDIWAEVLGVPEIGIYDNFFDLGGHSLLATQLVSRLHDRHGIDVPLRLLFEAPTIEQLGRTIDDGERVTA